MTDSLENLNQRLKQFASERNWEQFHNPKNLSMALIAEAAELLEHFTWIDAEASYQLDPAKKQEVSLEMADILIFLLRIAERTNIDLIEATNQKIEINEKRFPVDKVRGMAVRGREVGQSRVLGTDDNGKT